MKKSNALISNVINILIYNKVFLILALIVTILTFSTNIFWKPDNLFNVLRQVTVTAILGSGFTLVLAIGAIDLSIGSVVGFVGILMAFLLKAGVNVYVVCILGILFAVCFELINAAIINTFKIHSFIVTLAMASVLRGLCYVTTNMEAVYGLPKNFNYFGQGYIGIFPFPVLVMILVTVVMFIIVNRMKFGKHVIAMGGNPEAARVCGISLKRTLFGTFSILGVCAGIAAIILTGRSASGQVTAGMNMELDVIAAVVIGGTPLTGGIANVFGTLAGVLIVGVVNNGLNLLKVNANWQVIVKGLLILTAVILDSLSSRIVKKSQFEATKK